MTMVEPFTNFIDWHKIGEWFNNYGPTIYQSYILVNGLKSMAEPTIRQQN